jgi:hypothetical protein
MSGRPGGDEQPDFKEAPNVDLPEIGSKEQTPDKLGGTVIKPPPVPPKSGDEKQ